MASASSSSALNAILPQIPTAPYVAYQKAMSSASRFVKLGQHDTAIDVLFQSARELLRTGQPSSGVDLTKFMLVVYDKKRESVSEESKGRLTQLIRLTGPAGEWRKTIIDKSIAWSAKHGPCPAGDPDLHHYVGELLYKEGAFENAEPHLLTSGKRDSARLLAEMFVQWSAASGAYGTFALRGTIPYLQDGNILAARIFINHLTSALPSNITSDATSIPVGDDHEVTLTKDSIVNFSQMVVLTCQRAQGDKNKAMKESWVRLCDFYQSKEEILASTEVSRALSEIATFYFDIPPTPPRTQASKPFRDIISSIFSTKPIYAILHRTK